MPRSRSLLAAAIGFPVLLSACGDAAMPPSGPGAETVAPALRVSARAAKHLRFQIKDRDGEAGAREAGHRAGVEAPAVVDLTWTGAGELVSESDRSRVMFPGSMLTQLFKGTFRPALVSGTVTMGKQNLAADPVDALIIRATQGSLEVVRTR